MAELPGPREAVLTPIPVLEGEQVAVAAQLLHDATKLPYTESAGLKFRYTWGPWLRGEADGPREALAA